MVDPFRNLSLVHAKDHPILAGAAAWSVCDIGLHCTEAGGVAVVLALSTAAQRRILRFDGVTDFVLAGGLSSSAVRIVDVTHLQWQGVNLRVESSCGSLAFWAATVAEKPHGGRADGAGDRTGGTLGGSAKRRPSGSGSRSG